MASSSGGGAHGVVAEGVRIREVARERGLSVVRAQSRVLKLPTVAPECETLAHQWLAEGWSPLQYLRPCSMLNSSIRAEHADHASHAIRAPTRAEDAISIRLAVVAWSGRVRVEGMARCSGIPTPRNIVLLGPGGTEKDALDDRPEHRGRQARPQARCSCAFFGTNHITTSCHYCAKTLLITLTKNLHMLIPELIQLSSGRCPVVFGPRGASPGPDWLCQMLAEYRTEVRALLNVHGAVLFRNFDVSSARLLEKATAAFSPDAWVKYREASTPRETVEGNVATSTTYPNTESIYQHNENSHVMSWPLYLMFCCEVRATAGGATPLCDVRRVYRRIPIGLRTRLEDEGFLYRRAFGYHKRIGFSWSAAFGLSSKSDLETYFMKNSMRAEWGQLDNDRLVATYRRWASLEHPITKERVWFNHGTFFNIYNQAEARRQLITRVVGLEGAPYHTFFGNGSAITISEYQELRSAYDAEMSSVPWERGDLMLIDNMLTSHGRESFEGPRRVLVTMTDRVDARRVAAPDTFALPTTQPRLVDIVMRDEVAVR
ncbi:TauD/TfdA family dioxygenase [Pendulispora brunnea]|uniref:TauD/TfdA family dioxygenase n=1 Tax=Pendulispora brunnea TaxID=2905690 RepID=A0ABZ2KJE3_9BACT